MLSSTEDGKWVSCVYQHPESGSKGADYTHALEDLGVRVARHDGLLFASGWHISADWYAKCVMGEAIARCYAEGLESGFPKTSNTCS